MGILFINKTILASRLSLNQLSSTTEEFFGDSEAYELAEVDTTLTSHEKRLSTLRTKYGTATRISQKEFWSELDV